MLALLPLVACLAGSAAWAGPNDYREFSELFERMRTVERVKPQDAITAYRAYLQVLPERDPHYAVEALSRIIDLTFRGLGQTDAALALCDETLAKYRGQPVDIRPLSDKAKILTSIGRAAEAGALLEKEWSRALIAPTSIVGPAVYQYYRALRAQGKQEQALVMARKALVTNPVLFSAWQTDHIDARPFWLYEAIIFECVGKNDFDEALRWAKLTLMMSGYNLYGVRDATQVVARVLRMRDFSETAAKAFEAAVQDPAKPNLLTGVKLPDLDAASITAGMEKAELYGKFYGLVALGRTQDAGDLVGKALAVGDNPGLAASLVGHAFLASDLNTARMSRWLDYWKTHNGPTALADFLKQDAGPGK